VLWAGRVTRNDRRSRRDPPGSPALPDRPCVGIVRKSGFFSDLKKLPLLRIPA
jgi:hypothetical protein